MELMLEAVQRTKRGKNEARRLRRAGRIPAVLYGRSETSGDAGTVAVAVDPKALSRILHSDAGVNTLIGLKVDGLGESRVLVKEYQLDPITNSMLHVDFYRVSMDRLINVTVQVLLKGEAPGVKQQGGVLDFVHREIEVECLPADIPEHIEVSVADLVMGQGIRLRDLVEGVRWTAVSDLDTLIVHVVAPRVEEAPAVEAVPEVTAEPEVIKRGKAEKPEEEG